LWLCAAPPGAAEDGPPPERAEEPEELPRSRRSTGDDSASLAPIGVADAQTLDPGEWALSYRYSLVHGDDMRDGTHREGTDELLQRYGETPRKRDRHVHLFGVSYAPHRRVTLSAKLPVISQETHTVAAGPPRNRFETESAGVGDLELRALVPFMRKERESLQVEMGITAPTGSIDERDRGADGRQETSSFPQQLGSGTVDLLPGLVYRGRWHDLSWGFVARGTFRIYRNDEDYRLGDEYLLSSWLAHSWTDWMSTSLRLSWNQRKAVHPEDETTQNPEMDPKRQAGEFLDIGPGVNFEVPLAGRPRFGVEMRWPFYQTVEGPQIERDWQLTAGWKWSF
jgi:hypothetical protein